MCILRYFYPLVKHEAWNFALGKERVFVSCNNILIQSTTTNLAIDLRFPGEVADHLLFMQEAMGSIPK